VSVKVVDDKVQIAVIFNRSPDRDQTGRITGDHVSAGQEGQTVQGSAGAKCLMITLVIVISFKVNRKSKESRS
jgi:hypothetical protein